MTDPNTPPAASERMTAEWQPTPANINALPDPVRRYIMHLETDCDPAGTIRSEVILREHTVPELQALCQSLSARAEAAERELATERTKGERELKGEALDRAHWHERALAAEARAETAEKRIAELEQQLGHP